MRLLLDVPAFRDPPLDVVRHCRLIEPTAHLVYMGEGAWFLGSVERSTIREAVGASKRALAAKQWRRMDLLKQWDVRKAATASWMWWEGTLLLQGFAGIEVFRGEPDSRIEEFLRRRDYAWRADLDAAQRRFLAEDDQDGRDEDPTDVAARYSSLLDDRKLREAHRWAFRRPISIVKPSPRVGAEAA